MMFLKIENEVIYNLKEDESNPNRMTKEEITAVANSIKKYGFIIPIIVNKDNVIIDGHQRKKAAEQLGMEEVPVVKLDVDKVDQKLLKQILNKLKGTHDPELDLEEYKFIYEEQGNLDLLKDYVAMDDEYINNIIQELDANNMVNNYEDGVKGSLAERYIVPPFSILNTTSAVWLDRKREWYDKYIPIKGATREGKLKIGSINVGADVSLFDPVLAEIIYKWFLPINGTILDPFAGDVEQQVVAGIKNYKFKGIELRKDQVEANYKIHERNNCNDNIELFNDDGFNLDKHIAKESVDLVFTCPPYYDLEHYSDNKNDLSNLSMVDFDNKYKQIIKKTFDVLKDNRFAVFVVGEVRSKKGIGEYYNFVGKTIQFALDAGYKYYNELILVTAIGSLPLRAGKQFNSGRKIGKRHQNILVFYKGNKLDLKDYEQIEVKEEVEE